MEKLTDIKSERNLSMSWQSVLTLVNADNLIAANIAMQQIYGDDPGTNELGDLNASSDGNLPATVNICQASFNNVPNSSSKNTSKSMLQDLIDTYSGFSGVQIHVYGVSEIPSGWADAGTFWGAYKVPDQ